MFDVTRASFYRIGEKKWYDLYITMAQIKEAMEEAILFAERDPSTIALPELNFDYRPVCCG